MGFRRLWNLVLVAFDMSFNFLHQVPHGIMRVYSSLRKQSQLMGTTLAIQFRIDWLMLN